jgi:hypothetical protein
LKANYLLAMVFLIIAGCKKETAKLSSICKVHGKYYHQIAWSGHQEYEPGNGNTFSFSRNTYSQKIKTADTTYQYSGTFIIYTGKPCDFTIATTICIADVANYTYRKIR